MKFLFRSAVGLFLFSLTIGILLLAAGQVFWAVQEAQENPASGRTPRERMVAVNIDTLTAVTATPVITSYGTVESWRSLELRSSVAGTLIDLAPEFRDGGAVTEGQMLFQIDPAKLETAVALAEADLADANAEVADAASALVLAQADVDIAESQLALRVQAVERQEGLRERGVNTELDVEAATIAQTAAAQTLVGQQQAYAQAVTRISRSEIALDRREIALQEARRSLVDSIVNAPFDGVMSNVTAVLGRLVTTNEQLGVVVDPSALEIAFRVSNTQFARMLGEDGTLRRAKVQLTLSHGSGKVELEGKIERAGAEVGEGQIGRIIYARLLEADATTMRPGDFLTVKISEPPMSDVAVIPASAATSDGRILLLQDDDRLEEVTVTILRRQGDALIVTNVPFERRYVVQRSPQTGPGIQVKPLTPPAPVAEGTAAPEPEGPEMIVLSDERRARLIAFIEANENMQASSKENVLAQLAEPEVSLEIVERFEAKMEQ